MDFGNEQKHADGNNSAQANGLKLKTLGAAVANKIAPTAQAMEKATGVNPTHDPDGKSWGLIEDLGHKVEQTFEAVNYRRHHSPIGAPSTQHAAGAGDHWSAAKKDTKDAGGLLADAAVEATNALGETTQRGLEKTQEGLNSAHVQVRGGLQEASDVAEGGKDRLVNDAREMKDGVASHVDENMAHTSTKTVPTTTAHTEGGGVLSSISSGLKSMAGRFTAPISGDEVTDRNVIDKASNSAQNTADTAAQKAQEAKDGVKGVVSTDTRSKAQDAKESTKQAGIDAKDTVKQAGLDAKENAVNAAQSAKDSVAGAARSVQDGIKQTTNDVEDFLTADLSPHSAGEAALQSGLIPSNTADELAAHPTSKA